MTRRNRTPEEKARRERIRELLQMANIGSMEDIQNLFKETIAEFMESGLEAELDEELGYSKYDYKNKNIDNSRNGHSSKALRTSSPPRLKMMMDCEHFFDPARSRSEGVAALRRAQYDAAGREKVKQDIVGFRRGGLPALEMWRYPFLETGRGNLSRGC